MDSPPLLIFALVTLRESRAYFLIVVGQHLVEGRFYFGFGNCVNLNALNEIVIDVF